MEWCDRLGFSELAPKRRKALHQLAPGRFRLSGGPRFQCGPGTGHPIVEAEHPYPSILKHMVHRGVVWRIRWTAFFEIRELIEPRHVPEMCVNRMSPWEIWKFTKGDLKEICEEPGRPRGIDGETCC